jgi:hypothetical protein
MPESNNLTVSQIHQMNRLAWNEAAETPSP